MATPTAGYLATVSTSPDGVTWTPMTAQMTVKPSLSRAELDATYLGQGDTIEHFIVGLLKGEFSLSGDYVNGDAPQGTIITNFLAGTDTWIKVLADGTHGLSAKCKVTKCEPGAVSANGKPQFTATCRINGTPTVI